MPASIYNSYLRLLKCVSYKTGLSMDVCACVWGSEVGSHSFMSTPYEHFTVKLANGLSRSVPLPVCECYSRHVTLCTLLVSLFYRSAFTVLYFTSWGFRILSYSGLMNVSYHWHCRHLSLKKCFVPKVFKFSDVSVYFTLKILQLLQFWFVKHSQTLHFKTFL